MSQIKTQDESRKKKDCEKDAFQYKNPQFRKSRNDRSKQFMAKLCQDPNYIQISNLSLKNKRLKTKKTAINLQVKNSGVSSFIIKIDQEFEAILECYSSWPQIINPELSKGTLAEFHDNIIFDEL
ncbi:hypothetical protein C2G38_2209778 [Gigaspora rosea]|uniref:Uncharacterized protein n=1 Tax=Gigaspora rosea TaxID=44941 RepID=A0A397UFN0_9GLOM|nr:hypothetical protein C2G38_2209778 [Gigaspora rosea]